MTLTWISFAAAVALLPPATTPGATNPAVTQSNIHSTICVSGWTKTIRPPASYTNALKKKQLRSYSDKKPGDYEEDHLISLEIGGAPRDPKNLWPEPYPSARQKDQVEDKLKRLVCSGQVSLAYAQACIRKNWQACVKKVSHLGAGHSAP